MALPATEAFTGGAAALSGSWTQQTTGTTVNKDGSGLGVASNASDDALAFWNADAFNNNQYAQVVVTTLPSSTAIFATVRASGSSSATRSCYQFVADGGVDATVFKYVSGTQSLIHTYTGVRFANGDLARIEVNGTTIACFQNASALGTFTDASLASGAAGVGSFDPGAKYDTWEGGNLGGGGATTWGAQLADQHNRVVQTA